MTGIGSRLDAGGAIGRIEAGPACARVEFGPRIKQRLATRDTVVYTLFVMIVILAAKSRFRFLPLVT